MEPPYQPVEPQKPSGFGIASLALAVLSGSLTLGCCLVSWIAGQVQTSYSVPGELEPVSIDVGWLWCCGPFLSLLGVVTGIIGVAQRNVNKNLGILGLVLNGPIFLIYVIIYVLLPLIALLVGYAIFGGMTF